MRRPTLIPRPESEELVLWVLRYARGRVYGCSSLALSDLLGGDADCIAHEQWGKEYYDSLETNSSIDLNSTRKLLSFLDIGTGSGAIAFALS